MRPELNKNIEPEEFIEFYWLKEELISFCRDCNIPTSGKKQELTIRICEFLKTGKIIATSTKKQSIKKKTDKQIALTSIIPEDYKNDESHREFFKSEIGEHFKFNVSFMNWMKENAGKTYEDAILEWERIYLEKKKGKKTEISSQFEYNQYTRDFFKANKNRSREDAIKCWKYKKSQAGHNRYEDSDLAVLK